MLVCGALPCLPGEEEGQANALLPLMPPEPPLGPPPGWHIALCCTRGQGGQVSLEGHRGKESN